MKKIGSLLGLLALLCLTAAGGGLQTAMFRVDNEIRKPSTAVAVIEPRAGAPGYYWLRIYFYSSLTANERKQAEMGGAQANRTHWDAVLQFGLDTHWTIWQVDMAVPGHTCTIASSDVDAKNKVQQFRFDGRELALHTNGVHVCDMSAIHAPNAQFQWDVDLTTHVVEGVDRRDMTDSLAMSR